MSNRLLAIFTLVLFFGGIYGIYYYLFIANVGEVEFDLGSFTGVTIKLESEYKKDYELNCNNACIFYKLPPVNYTLKATKEGYKDIEQEINLLRGEQKKIAINLEKLVYTEEVKIPNEEKIALIRFEKENSGSDQEVKKQVIGTIGAKIYFYEYNPDFGVYSNEKGVIKNIYNIEGKKVDKVIFNKNDGLILMKSGNFNYLYDISSDTSYSLNIQDDIIYPKKTIYDGKYLIKTNVGTYLYDTSINSGVKNTVYNDYIIVSDGLVIGLINKVDKEKLNLFNFSDNNKDKLILNNIDTRERKVIFETSDNIDYLEFIDKKVYMVGTDGKSFEVKELTY